MKDYIYQIYQRKAFNTEIERYSCFEYYYDKVRNYWEIGYVNDGFRYFTIFSSICFITYKKRYDLSEKINQYLEV